MCFLGGGGAPPTPPPRCPLVFGGGWVFVGGRLWCGGVGVCGMWYTRAETTYRSLEAGLNVGIFEADRGSPTVRPQLGNRARRTRSAVSIASSLQDLGDRRYSPACFIFLGASGGGGRGGGVGGGGWGGATSLAVRVTTKRQIAPPSGGGLRRSPERQRPESSGWRGKSNRVPRLRPRRPATTTRCRRRASAPEEYCRRRLGRSQAPCPCNSSLDRLPPPPPQPPIHCVPRSSTAFPPRLADSAARIPGLESMSRTSDDFHGQVPARTA